MSGDDEGIYRELVEGQQDLVVRFSHEGRIQFVNRAYCALVGKTKEELADSVFMPVTDTRTSDILSSQMTRLFKPPYACIVDQWLLTKDGRRCISWSAQSVLSDDGTVRSIVATGRDVTRQKKERRAIRKRDEELRLLIESGARMYYTHSPDHTMIYVSPRIRALLGCTPKTGKMAWTDYLTDNPANGRGLERTLHAITTGRREPPYRIEFARADGVRVWVEVDEIPVVKDQKTVAIVGSLVDVTETMRVEEGAAEADVLIRNYSDGKTAAERHGVGTEAGPLAAIRSLFSPKNDDTVHPLSEDEAGLTR
ncbi:MAG: PAS domain-containing protein [Methanoregula sp.]|jgi:PAS domain S-box-containing protein